MANTEPVKSGILPAFIDDGIVHYCFMIPSDPKFGGDKPQVAKGIVDPGESIAQAAVREGEEELGLRSENIKRDVGLLTERVNGTCGPYNLHVFIVEVISMDDFDFPGFETEESLWLTCDEFTKLGRKEHINIVRNANNVITEARIGEK